MDIVLTCAVVAFLTLSHMAAYHLGGIKACNKIEKAVKTAIRCEREVKK